MALLLAGLGWPLVPDNGLVARYYPTQQWTGAPAFEGEERQLRPEVVRDRANRLFPGQRFSATWEGFLLVEQEGPYTFSVTSDGETWLSVDGQALVAPSQDAERGATVQVTEHLEPGLRWFEVRYAGAGEDPELTVEWAFDGAEPALVPARHLFPTGTAYRVRNLGYGYLLPLIVSLGLAAVPVVWGGRHLAGHLRAHAGERGTNLALLAVLALTAGLAVPVVTWGLPFFVSWAPDELAVSDVLDGLRQRFSGGWHGAYPPFHYYLLGLLVLPFELAEQGGLTRVLVGQTQLTLSVMFRLVSTLLALGTVYLAYRIAFEIDGNRLAGVFAALLLTGMPLLVYYAGLANLDMPYVFWATLAMFFCVRLAGNPHGSDLTGFGVAAALAVCTKDQAYAFFVLPAGYALWLRGRASGLSWYQWLRTDRGPLTATAATLGAAIVAQNLLFNLEGFRAHVGYLLDTSTYPPRYPATVAGIGRMLAETVAQLSWSMGWPTLIAGTVGLGAMLMRGSAPGIALSLFVGSYYLFFIAVIRYQFDRFFLGVAVVLAVGAGLLLARLVQIQRWAPAARLASALVILSAVSYGAWIPVAMTADSRYRVEAWLASEVREGERVGYVGRRTYLPRFAHGAVRVLESWPYVGRHRPDVLVVNVPYSCRARPGSSRLAFYERLGDPANGLYELALAHRADPWWPTRGPDAVFRAACENSMTSLSRINPEIRVYRRVAPS
jgi:hypothetical protein